MVLNSNTDIGSTLSKPCEHYIDNDTIYLARDANIQYGWLFLRFEIFVDWETRNILWVYIFVAHLL